MQWKSVLFGVIATLMVLFTISMAIAGLGGDSTLLASVTVTDPGDGAKWMTIDGYSNTDATKTFCVTMPNEVASTMQTRLTKDYETEIVNDDFEMVPNPVSPIEHSLTRILSYHSEQYHAQVIEEWENGKPIGLE